MLLWACADGEEGKALLTRASSVSDDYLQFLSRPHHIEKRFLVDRKKLEKLITGGCGRVEKAWQGEAEVYLHVEWAERGCVLDIQYIVKKDSKARFIIYCTHPVASGSHYFFSGLRRDT